MHDGESGDVEIPSSIFYIFLLGFDWRHSRVSISISGLEWRFIPRLDRVPLRILYLFYLDALEWDLAYLSPERNQGLNPSLAFSAHN